jgi:hypothetical protein
MMPNTLVRVASRALGLAAVLGTAPLLVGIVVALRLTGSGTVLDKQICEDAEGRLFRTHTFHSDGPVGRVLASFGLEQLTVFFSLANGEVTLSPLPECPQSVFALIKARTPIAVPHATARPAVSSEVIPGNMWPS